MSSRSLRKRNRIERFNEYGVTGGAGQVYDWRRTVTAKTASFTITQADSGTVFTNRGDTDVLTITLPTVSDTYTGVQFEAYGVANTALALSAQTAGQLVVKADATANSIAYETSGEIIGACFRVICDGTSWLVIEQSNETVTPAITT